MTDNESIDIQSRIHALNKGKNKVGPVYVFEPPSRDRSRLPKSHLEFDENGKLIYKERSRP